MPREFSRTRRVEEQLRRDLAEMIRHEIKEPGLGIVSITEIKVSPDLAVAQVYITILQDDHELVAYTLETLQSYAGKLRGLLGKRMHIRKVPQLTFIYDDTIQKGNQLDRAIDHAVAEDRKKSELHPIPTDGEDDNG